MNFMEHYGHLVTEESIDIVSKTIARMLRPHCSTYVEWEELESWARLGVTVAMDKFDPARMEKVPVENPQAWLCGYLVRKGYFAALDEMRSAHVVGRFRNGTFYGAPLPTQSFSEVEDSGGESVVIEAGDEGDGDPANSVDLADLVETVSDTLGGHEKTIFDLRYRLGMTLQQIARKIGLTPARVYQIHSMLIERLRDYLSDGGCLCPA